jgi:L-lactate dehydrogenase complex protein LldF
MSVRSFHARIRQSIADENLQIALDGNARRRMDGRVKAFSSLPDHQERRSRAHAIKVEVISHLDDTLDQFITQVTANGIQVYRAASAQDAIRIFLEIVGDQGVHLVAKSKSMLSEEINFNHALEAEGIQVIETDLGEYIVQLRGERPSHILTPAVHLRRGQVGELFHEKLGIPYTEDIPEMVATARRILRNVFLTADIGVSGVNFGVAETGTLCIVTNEGNGRMVTSVPPVHVALMGMERLVPTLDDLALFLSLLPRSGTGQKLSVYTSLIHSPRRTQDADGPRARHLILVDNGRSALRSSPLAESLFCIRCGACLNVCPVFREIGGHTYLGRDGSIAPYPGPIGSVISPGLLGCENFGHLAQASSLCGACKEACPVDINLPDLLLRIRAGEMGEGTRKYKEGVGIPPLLKLGLKAFRLVAGAPSLFSIGQWLGGLFSRLVSPFKEYMHLPAWTGWGFSKDFPRLSMQPFRHRWKSVKQTVEQYDQGFIQAADASPFQPPDAGSLTTRFISELADIGGTAYLIPEKEVQSRLVEFLHERSIERICMDPVVEKYAPNIPFVCAPDPAIRVGVTGVLAGIAESGSLVLVGGEDRPLTASLLPDIHIAILRESELVLTLSDALNKPEIRTAPAAVIITGPSRTADIEMTLSIGVHGPKELFVFVIEDSK